MNFRFGTRISAAAAAIFLTLSALPVFADGTESFSVHFEDVTASDSTTLSGEAKIKVSISGASGNTTIVQNAFKFDGLKYKSVRFLKGENNPPSGYWYAPQDISAVNADKGFTLGIASKNGLNFSNNEEVFIITFSGNPGDEVNLRLNDDMQNTYCVTDGNKAIASGEESITAAASSRENKGKNAVVKLTMDKVPSFNAAADTGITLKIISETTTGYVITNTLSNVPTQEGGHRESTDIPSFTVENTVLDGDTYTVEVSGIGYVPFKKSGVTFDKPFEITNADFIPGDVVKPFGTVDVDDKKAVEEMIQNNTVSEAADFNRDGKVNALDLEVFSNLPDGSAPSKMSVPEVSGGNKKITLTWNKPSDEDITGYVINYGGNSANLTKTKEITGADVTSADITGLSAGTTYYVRIAAKNAYGTGEFSDIANVKTNADTGNTGTIGGGGGSGGGGGIAPVKPTKTEKPAIPQTPDTSGTWKNDEPFTDLDNYAWAKDSVYTLKNKGIINGISETEFAPENNIKRGDFILILMRMLSVADSFTDNFTDVPPDSYYYNAIGSARKAGIAKGSGESFMPEASITRQDLITLAYRAFLAKGYISESTDTSTLDIFSDKNDISDYASIAMASMVDAGIIKGADNKVNPLGNATRAEVAVMCARLLGVIEQYAAK